MLHFISIRELVFRTSPNIFRRKFVDEVPRIWHPPKKLEDLFTSALGHKVLHLKGATSGARIEKTLPCGDASFQLYSLATPNGMKAAILLEELGIEYDAHNSKLNIFNNIKYFELCYDNYLQR
jgi:hypothetical protein